MKTTSILKVLTLVTLAHSIKPSIEGSDSWGFYLGFALNSATISKDPSQDQNQGSQSPPAPLSDLVCYFQEPQQIEYGSPGIDETFGEEPENTPFQHNILHFVNQQGRGISYHLANPEEPVVFYSSLNAVLKVFETKGAFMGFSSGSGPYIVKEGTQVSLTLPDLYTTLSMDERPTGEALLAYLGLAKDSDGNSSDSSSHEEDDTTTINHPVPKGFLVSNPQLFNERFDLNLPQLGKVLETTNIEIRLPGNMDMGGGLPNPFDATLHLKYELAKVSHEPIPDLGQTRKLQLTDFLSSFKNRLLKTIDQEMRQLSVSRAGGYEAESKKVRSGSVNRLVL